MSDEQASASDEPVESPTPQANPKQQNGSPAADQSTDWEQRYKDTFAWGNSLNEQLREASAYRDLIHAYHSDDPEASREAAQILGFPVEDEPEADSDEDLRRQIRDMDQRFNAFTEAQQQAQQQQVDVAVINEGLYALQQKLGRDLSQADCNMLGKLAEDNRDEHGRPDFGAVADWYESSLAADRDQQSQGRRSRQRPPAPPLSGVEGTEAPDMNDAEARVAHMTRQWIDMSAD